MDESNKKIGTRDYLMTEFASCIFKVEMLNWC